MQRAIQYSARRCNTSQAPRAQIPSLSSRLQTASFSSTTRCPAHSDYGSGEIKDGPNPSRDKEHPGPPPPDTGKGGSTGSTDKGRPTIHVDQRDVKEQDEAVRQHNEEVDKRFAKSHHKDSVNDPKDKVHKGYWKGEGDQ